MDAQCFKTNSINDPDVEASVSTFITPGLLGTAAKKETEGGGQNKISNSCQSSEDLDEMFTLKMGMMQTGPLVGFGHRPLNKFQL